MWKYIKELSTILVLVVVIMATFSGCKKADATDSLKLTQDDEKVIYEYLDTKTNDVQRPLGNGKVISAFKVFGTDDDKIYLWFFRKEVIKSGGEIVDVGGGVASPLVLNVKKTEEGLSITGHKQPVDGEYINQSIKNLFPPNVVERMKGFEINGLKELSDIIKNRAMKEL